MTLSDLVAIGSFISSLALLASLVYVGVQVRQASRHARAATGASRADRLVEISLRMAESPEFADLVSRGRSGEPLTPLELGRFETFARMEFWSAEDNYLQFREGLLQHARYRSFRYSMLGLMRGAGMLAAWELLRASFDPGFAAFMDDVVDEARLLGLEAVSPEAWDQRIARIREAAAVNADVHTADPQQVRVP